MKLEDCSMRQHRNPWDQPKWSHASDPQQIDKEHDSKSAFNEVKHELSDEEKEVLKDIHGEFHDKTLMNGKCLTLPGEQQVKATCSQPGYQPRRIALITHHEHKYDDFVRNFDSGDVLHRHGFIGDVHLGQEAWELKPIQISHFIGDSVIDLTRASIPLGRNNDSCFSIYW